MADKVVNATQLDADLLSIAEAIREKGGTSAALLFPDEFITAINELDSGYPVTVRHCGANAIIIAYSGGKTETATANADGVAVFEKLAKGVWVFSSAKQTDNRVAEIVSATDISFNTIYIYNRGDTCDSLTGGWGINGWSSGSSVPIAKGTLSSASMTLNGVGNTYVTLGTDNVINVAEYSKIHILGKNISNSGGICFQHAGLHSAKTVISTVVGETAPSGTVGEFHLEYDIPSNYTELYASVSVGGATACKGEIYEIYFDRKNINNTPNGLIIYSAPVGLTVTATKGGENLPVSKTTVGDKELHCFIVKPQYFGEITVTCGDKVQTVTVDSNVVVMLTHSVYLFKDGNQYADITGGWARASTSTSSGSTVTIGNTMEVKSLATAGAILAITGKQIDFANYANAKIKISSITKGSQTPSIVFEIHNTTGYSDVSASQSVSAAGTYEIPLDALSTGFVALKVYCATVIVDAVWLE